MKAMKEYVIEWNNLLHRNLVTGDGGAGILESSHLQNLFILIIYPPSVLTPILVLFNNVIPIAVAHVISDTTVPGVI